MRQFIKILTVFFLCLFTLELTSYAQVTKGFKYHAVIRDALGIPVPNHTLKIRFSIYFNSPAGTLSWQEDQIITTDNYGLAEAIIGTGTSTGAGSTTFNGVNWGVAVSFLKVSIDLSGGSAFTDMGTTQLFSVPYALFSAGSASADRLLLEDMHDVDITANSPGKLLKWNGNYWVPGTDLHKDTVLFSSYSGAAIHSDTASYTFGIPLSDTASYANTSDTSKYSISSGSSLNTQSTPHADTATYAFVSLPYAWKINGNSSIISSTQHVGTNDNTDMNIRTNNISRISLKNNGNILAGNASGNASMYLSGNDGIISTGVFGNVFTSVAGSGTKLLWYPSKGSFRAGGVNSTQWDTANIGEYSMAFGYDTKAHIRSFSSGYETESVDYSFASGRRCRALPVGGYPEGNSVSIGDSCIGMSYRDVTIGRNNTATGAINITIGFSNISSSGQSVCLGSFCNVAGTRSTVFGYHANTSALKSGFVYADASSNSSTTPSIAYQFIVRASGGIVFYTDSLNTTGATIFPGSGSWAVVSDRNKKANPEPVNYEEILQSINRLKIKQWNYISQSRHIHHLGPMAQDFYDQFHFGENNTSISGVDIDGVILAGIKALDMKFTHLNNINEVAELKARANNFDTDDLSRRLDVLEEALKNK